MRFRFTPALLLLWVLLACDLSRASDLALIGAKIYPSPIERPIENGAIFIHDGPILAVGPSATVKIPRYAEVNDCKGLVVTAGFWNSHVHILTPGLLHAEKLSSEQIASRLQEMLTRWGFTTVFDIALPLHLFQHAHPAIFAVQSCSEQWRNSAKHSLARNLRPWPKGVSGNPGRPKKTALTDAIREQLAEVDEQDKAGRTNAEIIAAALVARAKRGDVRAAGEIADRAEGRPSQSLNLQGRMEVSTLEERRARVERMLNQFALSQE